MDPGWPYAYNRLVAATAASGSSGNFSHLAGTTTAHHSAGSVTATPLIVQPTAVPTTVNPYGASSFLPPPTVGYDVFSTLFHPHAAAAAQVSSQAAANLKSLNYGSALDARQQEVASNSSTNSTSSSSTQHQQQQQQAQQTYNYQNAASISRPSANLPTWNSNTSSGQTGGSSQQFGSPSAVNSSSGGGGTSTPSNSSLATITRVNSNGCSSSSSSAAAAAAATTSAMYDNYNAQLKAHSLYQLNSHLANAAVMAMANKLNANRTTLSVPQLVSLWVGSLVHALVLERKEEYRM